MIKKNIYIYIIQYNLVVIAILTHSQRDVIWDPVVFLNAFSRMVILL